MSKPRFAVRAALALLTACWIAGIAPAVAQQQAPPNLTPYAQRFIELFDINHDGKIALPEILSDQGRLFGAIDLDGDQTLSIEEVRRRGRFLQMWRTTTLFDLLDVNGDGQLSAQEINAPVQRWFKRYDRNGDGVMDLSEIPDRRNWDGDNQR